VGLGLRRADVQLRLSSLLGERVRSRGDPFAGPFGAAQRRFVQYWRSAESRLAAGEPAAEAGPQGQSLADWLQQLGEQNRQLAATALLRELQSEAERQARLEPSGPVGSERTAPSPIASPPGPDVVAFWQAAAAGPPPRFQLASAAGQRAKEAIAASVLVLLVLLAVWFLSYLPGVPGAAWLRRQPAGGSPG
jgi:hypothetical protein